MAIDEHALAGALQGGHGVITTAQLRRIGVGEQGVRTLVANGRLARVHRGVFVGTAAPRTFQQRAAIASAITGGVVMYPSAGVVWYMRQTPRHSDIHVWVEHGRRVDAPPGVVVHRTTALPSADVVRRPDGIAVTSPPRTVFDAAAVVHAETLESIVEQGLQRGWFIIPTLWATGRRLRRRGRAGSGLFAAVLNSRPMWLKPVDSDHELRLERALRKRGFPPLTRQHPLEIEPGTVIHPDLGLPDDGFYIEVDHFSWHGGRYVTTYDHRRDRKMRRRGFQVERVTDTDLDLHLADAVEGFVVAVAAVPSRRRRCSRPMMRCLANMGAEAVEINGSAPNFADRRARSGGYQAPNVRAVSLSGTSVFDLGRVRRTRSPLLLVTPSQ